MWLGLKGLKHLTGQRREELGPQVRCAGKELTSREAGRAPGAPLCLLSFQEWWPGQLQPLQSFFRSLLGRPQPCAMGMRLPRPSAIPLYHLAPSLWQEEEQCPQPYGPPLLDLPSRTLGTPGLRMEVGQDAGHEEGKVVSEPAPRLGPGPWQGLRAQAGGRVSGVRTAGPPGQGSRSAAWSRLFQSPESQRPGA